MGRKPFTMLGQYDIDMINKLNETVNKLIEVSKNTATISEIYTIASDTRKAEAEQSQFPLYPYGYKFKFRFNCIGSCRLYMKFYCTDDYDFGNGDFIAFVNGIEVARKTYYITATLGMYRTYYVDVPLAEQGDIVSIGITFSIAEFELHDVWLCYDEYIPLDERTIYAGKE